MTSWYKLLMVGPTRIALLLSGALHVIAIVVGAAMLAGGDQAPAPASYFGVDLPALLYLVPYRVYWPDCNTVFGRDVVTAALSASAHVANLGYLVWLLLVPIYLWRVLNFRAVGDRIFQHPGDTVGLPPQPRLVNVARYPSRRAIVYAGLLLIVLLMFGRLILSGSLSNAVCGAVGASSVAAVAAVITVPALQVIGFLILEWVIFEVIRGLYAEPHADLSR